MDDKVVKIPPTNRHNQAGYYSLADLPQQRSVRDIALDTGWWEFDQIFKFYPGQFTVVTGIAGHGKSTFLFNLLHNMAQRHGSRTFMFIPENEAHVRERLRKIHDGDDKSFHALAANNFYVQSAVPEQYDQPQMTLRWVLQQAAEVIEKDNLDFLLIDPWNELEHAKPKELMMTDYIGQSLMMLKSFARSLSVSIVLVAHPTKAVTEGGKPRTPTLADVEGSMNWYNKADNGLIVSRDFEKNTAKVVSAKVRELGAGKVGCCWFTVNPETGVFAPQHGAVQTGVPA